MLNWSVMLHILQQIEEHKAALEAAYLNSSMDKKKFQNIDYEISCLPLVLNVNSANNFINLANRYMVLLNKLIDLFFQHEEIQAYFKLDANAFKLINASKKSSIAGDYLGVLRLDTLIDHRSNDFYILENNSDCPAGTLFTGRLNNYIHTSNSRVIKDYNQFQFENYLINQDDFVYKLFLDQWKKYNKDQKLNSIVILQEKGKSNFESIEMAKELKNIISYCEVVDPNLLEFKENGVYVNNIKIDLIWNKINTVFWDREIIKNTLFIDKLAEAISEKKVVHLNSFLARYITENKMCSAIFQDEKFRKYFSHDEVSLIQKLIPWTKRLMHSNVVYRDNSHDLYKLVLNNQIDFVIKEPYDIRGDGVTIGCDVSFDKWKSKIDEGFQKEWLIQEYIKPVHSPILNELKSMDILFMPSSLDFFYSGKIHLGFGSKASFEKKLNLFKGGRKLSVMAS